MQISSETHHAKTGCKIVAVISKERLVGISPTKPSFDMTMKKIFNDTILQHVARMAMKKSMSQQEYMISMAFQREVTFRQYLEVIIELGMAYHQGCSTCSRQTFLV